MKKKLHIQAVFAALILLNPVASFSAGLFNSAKGPDIITNNRIITTVHGHPISILDIQKEMDLVFFQKFPQYGSSPEARLRTGSAVTPCGSGAL